MHFRTIRLPDKLTSDHFLTADGQHGSATRPSAYTVPLALLPYPYANEGTGLPGIDSMG